MLKKKISFHPTPPQTIAFSFAAMILTGALFLTLPFASQDGKSVGFLNALFTATSANCVTGLVVVNTQAHWSIFGKVIILILIQLGGIGFISILTANMIIFRKRIGLRSRIAIQASFNQDSVGGMVRLVRSILVITLVVESIGAVLLAFAFYGTGTMTVWQSMYRGVFHSISAFCNAGFDILGPSSLVPYQGNWSINLIIMSLIIIGGLGFTVWGEVIQIFKKRKTRSWRKHIIHLSLHSKIAITITMALLFLGTFLFLILEWSNPDTLGNLPASKKVLAALFQSVTLRTCGFNSIDQGGLTDISQVISVVLMLIGGSPAGTAGGIKTVTLGIILASVISAVRGKNSIEIFGRTMPLELLQKALTVTYLLFTLVASSVFILHFSEMGSAFSHTVLDLLFEVASAAGTVGVTTGITPFLSSIGKMVIVGCMYIGRLGPVTAVFALYLKMKDLDDGISYPEETVIVG